MAYVDFLSGLHQRTKRDYLQRVVEYDKAECAEVAIRFGKDYWDGDRKYGYGGYRYDGRWRSVAEEMVRHYGLRPGASILDVGCGKGFLLYEFTQVLRDAQVAGLDISEYAIANAKEEVKVFLLYEFTQVLCDAQVAGLDISEYAIGNAKEEVKGFLRVGTAAQLPFADRSFDLVISILTLHNLDIYDLWSALREIERVGRGARYVVVEAYRNEREKVNLMYWQLTCRAFHTPAEWEWVFSRAGYSGDHSFIVFE